MTTASSSAASAAAQLPELQAEVRRVLVAYAEQPGDAGIWQELLNVRRRVAAKIAALPTAQKGGSVVEVAFSILHDFEQSGAADRPVAPEDAALVDSYRKANWPGLLASMLLVPAWQWPTAPALDDVQPWLWAEYTRWLFYTPKGFTAVGQAEEYAAQYLKRLEDLATWGTRNRGSAAVHIALQVYMRGNNCIPLYFANGSLKRHYELRAKILKAALGVGLQQDLLPVPRDGRRLRVGFINRHFAPQTETYTTLPTFEQLDPQRFEVILFAHGESGTKVEEYARSCASDFQILSGDLSTQVAALRAANLDVAVFGTNVTAVCHEVTLLALHRVAPLQVVNNSSCTTTGMPEIDLYISGDLTESPDAPKHFSERLGLLPGPAHAFNYEADVQEPTTEWTRESLQLPEDAIVFVTAANYYKVIPEMQHAWARILAAVPNSRLLIHPFNPNWSSNYPIKRFCAEFDRVIAEYGVSSERLIVSTSKFPSRVDVRQLLSVGDIYLDTFPFGGVNSLVDPLEAGIPVIAWEGETFRSRMGAALLRSLKLDEFIATTADSYETLAVRLAGDSARRGSLNSQIREAMARTPVFRDTLAASDAFGDLIEYAYDRLCVEGREAFRNERLPLCASAHPSHVLASGLVEQARLALRANPAEPALRRKLGCALINEGQSRRALEYFVAAVQQDESNADLWFDVARALQATGERAQAIEALETCIKINGEHLEAWVMIAGLARDCGNLDIARDAAEVAKRISPHDPRLHAFAF